MEKYTTHIKAKNNLLDFNLKELVQYRDLILLFFKRNYVTKYKQTILGPLWLILNPLITVTLYAFVFGNLAGLSDSGVPQFVFYLCSNSLWSFFSTCLTQTSTTFTANAEILGKVYFPRLIMPISSVVSGLFDLMIQLLLLGLFMAGYYLSGINFNIGVNLIFAPLIILEISLLGLGCGIIIASVTTKYRDLVILVGFGVHLWMYASPVVYSVSKIPMEYYNFYMVNPIAPIMEFWRNSIIGVGIVDVKFIVLSWVITLIVLFFGIMLFNKVEKTFMDTV